MRTLFIDYFLVHVWHVNWLVFMLICHNEMCYACYLDKHMIELSKTRTSGNVIAVCEKLRGVEEEEIFIVVALIRLFDFSCVCFISINMSN